MIRCTDVHKTYRMEGREVRALRGVNLEIAGNGSHAIMGQSGSGKSTLLHLMGALDRPDRGTIEVAGNAVHSLEERDATAFRRTQIGIVFQQFNLIPTLTARENVELPGMLAGEDAGRLRRRSNELLDRLGLAERAGHRPDALSGGEQQRAAIARALLFSPPVLLADEPTGNLDSASSERIWALLAELAAERDMTVVMVTHEPAAAAHCRAVHVLQDGVFVGGFETGGLDAAGVAACYQRVVRPA
jgi:putative ABC transport system ATP-binding protein